MSEEAYSISSLDLEPCTIADAQPANFSASNSSFKTSETGLSDVLFQYTITDVSITDFFTFPDELRLRAAVNSVEIDDIYTKQKNESEALWRDVLYTLGKTRKYSKTLDFPFQGDSTSSKKSTTSAGDVKCRENLKKDIKLQEYVEADLKGLCSTFLKHTGSKFNTEVDLTTTTTTTSANQSEVSPNRKRKAKIGKEESQQEVKSDNTEHVNEDSSCKEDDDDDDDDDDEEYVDSCEDSKGDHDKVHRIEKSLIVTTSSKPDMIVLHRCSKTAVMVEFKQSSNYSRDIAAKQCCAYLHCFLYICRSIFGLPVEKVYGVAYCGNQCNDTKMKGSPYDTAVGLIKLSAPLHLGGKLVAEQYWELCTKDSITGIQLLLLFLTEGKFTTMQDTNIQNAAKPIPALFGIPTKYWNDKLGVDSGLYRKLIVNGTHAIVFKVNMLGLIELVEDIKANLLGNTQKEKDRLEYFEKQFSFSDQMTCETNNMGNEEKSSYFYIKVRTSDSSTHFSTDQLRIMYLEAKDDTSENVVCQDIKNLFVVPPYIHPNFYCIIMKDLGSRLDKAGNSIKYKKMKTMLFNLQEYMHVMLKFGLFHGDFLPHNFIYDADAKEGKIKVIDFDEASFQSTASRRVMPKGDSRHWFNGVRYPNVLRKECYDYTEVQFAAGVVQLLRGYKDEDSQQDLNKLQRLEIALRELSDKYIGSEYDEKFKNDLVIRVSAVNDCVNALLSVDISETEKPVQGNPITGSET